VVRTATKVSPVDDTSERGVSRREACSRPTGAVNSNLALSQLAASADVEVFGTARRLFGDFCYAASKDTNTICLPA
jgi:hypothetical protein